MDSHEIERAISDLEVQIDRVRALYEQYFLGMEKLEPLIPRKNLERALHRLRRQQLRNTAQRFRFQQLVQRYNTLQTYWRRISRQIEEGTYRRDIMRARTRNKRKEAQAAEVEQEAPADEQTSVDASPSYVIEDSLEAHIESNFDALFDQALQGTERVSSPASTRPADVDAGHYASPSSSPVLPPTSQRQEPGPLGAPPSTVRPRPLGPTPPLPAAPRPPVLSSGAAPGRSPVPPLPAPSPTQPRRPVSPPVPRDPAAGGAPQLPQSRIQNLYNDYVAARQSCNQNVSGMSYDKVERQIRQQEAALKRKHGGNIDFRVEVREGKAVLRPVRRKK